VHCAILNYSLSFFFHSTVPHHYLYSFPTRRSSDLNSFVLQVKGSSMIEDHILDGDFVVCEQTQVANAGDIVVALIGGEEATLKRSEEHTSELQSLRHLVCRLLLEKKKQKKNTLKK